MFSYHFESQGWHRYRQSETKRHLNNHDQSESILGALLVHFSSQNGAKMHQKSDKKSIEKNIGKKTSRNH